MAHLLFVDESGHDRKKSPYEVLAGVAVEDRDLWNLIQSLKDSELKHFGRPYRGPDRELKATRLLKTKTFRLAAQLAPMEAAERAVLAERCLDSGASAGMRELTALAQAKIAYVADALATCIRFRCRAFASIVSVDSPVPDPGEQLRKDYSYLFERFYYYLEDLGPDAPGLVVFDELDKTKSHLLVDQMDFYFQHTRKGRGRAGRIIPEPFFVHSDLTTGIQLADFVAYLVSWGFRNDVLQAPRRAELAPLVRLVEEMWYRSARTKARPFRVWSYTYIPDLRARSEREGARAENGGKEKRQCGA